MSRTFVTSNEDQLYNNSDTGFPTAPPFTVCIWAYPTSLSANIMAWSLTKRNFNADYFSGVVRTDGAAGCNARRGGNTQSTTTNTASVNTWWHHASIFTSTISRRCILNGDWTNSNEDTTSKAPNATTPRGFSWGFNYDSTPSNWFEGQLAWGTVWDVALTQPEIEALANGLVPWRIRPASIVSLHPLNEPNESDSSVDIIGGFNFTAGATTGSGPEAGTLFPPLILPGVHGLQGASAASPEGDRLPLLNLLGVG